MQLTTSWEAKGIIKGQIATILRLLNRKFDSISPKITSRIESLDASQLDALTEDLLDFQSLNDLNQWLDSH